MAIPWLSSVQTAKKLTVFPSPDLKKWNWDAVFSQALTEFNALSSKNSLGVTLTASSNPPDTQGYGGANVQFSIGNGTITYTAFGSTTSDTLNGNATAGTTKTVSDQSPTGAIRIAKAFTFVPATPRFAGHGSRIVGDPVKLVIAVHELFHACGLENADHSSGPANEDVFSTAGTLMQGASSAQDKVQLPSGQTKIPPLFLSSATVNLIKAIWP
jgi:hypothetical protein